MTKRTKTIEFPFFIAGILVMIFGLDIIWWQAILVGILTALRIKIAVR